MRAVSALVLACATLFAASTAHAAWTADDRVKEIKQSRLTHDDGKTVIVLESVTCPSGGSFYITSSSSNKDLQLKLLMAALMSGRSVQLGYNEISGGGCDVYSVVLK